MAMALSGKTWCYHLLFHFFLGVFRPGSLVEISEFEGEEDGTIWSVIKFKVGYSVQRALEGRNSTACLPVAVT